MNSTRHGSAEDRLQHVLPAVKRLHIIGGPGSGKSTLARRLGVQLNLPVFELDTIAFQGLDFDERPLEARRQAIREIAAQPAWITEGIFVGWVDELLEQAELILWLDGLPWHSAAARIVRRFARLGWQEMRRQKGTDKFMRFRDYGRHLVQLLQVMGTSRSYYFNITQPLGDARHVTRAQTQQQLSAYWTKVVHCTSADAVARFYLEVANLQTTNRAEPTVSTAQTG